MKLNNFYSFIMLTPPPPMPFKAELFKVGGAHPWGYTQIFQGPWAQAVF